MNIEETKQIIEAALLTAGEPLSATRLAQLFDGENSISNKDVKDILKALSSDYMGRSFELKEVASGYRIQIRSELAPYLVKLVQERPPRYSRALMETLSLIIYRQPLTRADIESVRGVTVSTNIIKTLLEHEWIKVVGHKNVPGKPALYASTKYFLDYFNLKSLDEMPALTEILDVEALEKRLGMQLRLDLTSSAQPDESKDESVGDDDLTCQEGGSTESAHLSKENESDESNDGLSISEVVVSEGEDDTVTEDAESSELLVAADQSAES